MEAVLKYLNLQLVNNHSEGIPVNILVINNPDGTPGGFVMQQLKPLTF